MDLAYDHIVEQSFGERSKTPVPPTSQSQSASEDNPSASSSSSTASAEAPQRQNLQTEFHDTFKAFSNSAWGKSFGGFWGNVKKQSESYYEEAVKEVGDLGADALKEFEGLKNKVVNVSAGVGSGIGVGAGRSRSDTVRAATTTDATITTSGEGDDEAHESKNTSAAAAGDQERGATAEAAEATLEENETFIARFKSEAAKRLKEVQKAEDAADDALLRFGTNIRNFLRDAVAVSAPEPSTSASLSSSREVLFESKDAATGKRVAHASRFDAQLYVIHTSAESFTRDPEEEGDQWGEFKSGFDVERETERVGSDLERYPELRGMMERSVPEQVEYKDFWTRYYFLRRVVEVQEEKRREMLKASTTSMKEDEQDLDWGDDDDDQDDAHSDIKVSVPPETEEHTAISSVIPSEERPTASSAEPETHKLTNTASAIAKDSRHLRSQSQPRRSHDEKSVADSDASYDLVSGTTSRTPGSPLASKAVEESEEEDDWE